MRKLHTFGILGLAAVGLIAAGCLVAGTWVIVQDVDFDFTADTGFYWYPVDLSENSTFEDHEEDINSLDAIGCVFTFTNTSEISTTFNAYLAAQTGPIDWGNPPEEVPTGAVPIVRNLTIAAGTTRKVTYAESLGWITDIEALKTIILSGRFDYFGTSTGGTDDNLFQVTNGKIIMTISASS